MNITTQHPNPINQKTALKQKMWPHALGIYIVGAILVLTFYAGTVVGFHRGKVAATSPGTGELSGTSQLVPEYLSKDVDFSLYWEVFSILKNGTGSANTVITVTRESISQEVSLTGKTKPGQSAKRP